MGVNTCDLSFVDCRSAIESCESEQSDSCCLDTKVIRDPSAWPARVRCPREGCLFWVHLQPRQTIKGHWMEDGEGLLMIQLARDWEGRYSDYCKLIWIWMRWHRVLKGWIVTGGMAHVDISLFQLDCNHYDGNWSWTDMANSTNQMQPRWVRFGS